MRPDPAVTPAMSVVLSKAANLNLKIELRDKRRLYIDGRPCQVIKSKWYENFPGCQAMTMYMPRGEFADFLLYVPDGQDIVYVVPRGKIAHDTAWAESALEPYKDAWHLLKETSPLLFERKAEALSGQLQKIIAEATKHNLTYELIPKKRSSRHPNDYRTYKQRRIMINEKKCAIFTAIMVTDESKTCDIAYFSAPKDDWPEFLLHILDDDVYVFPASHFLHHDTTLSLDSGYVFDYRNAWCVLEGVDPTSWKEMREYRKKFAK